MLRQPVICGEDEFRANDVSTKQIQVCSSSSRWDRLGCCQSSAETEIRGNNQFGGFEFQESSLTG